MKTSFNQFLLASLLIFSSCSESKHKINVEEGIWITNATIISPENKDIKPIIGTVIIDHDQIVYVGQEDVLVTGNHQKIDATGKYLIPGFLGILWSLSAHAFIINFQSVPEKAKRSDGFLHRLKRNVHRSWYWIIAFIFTGTTVAAVFFTFRLVSIWLNDYNG